MPIPFILGGIALVTAGYGVKKGIDAKEDFDTAKSLNEKAEKIYNKAKKKLENKRENTNKKLQNLGSLKVGIYKGSLKEFNYVFQKIKNIDFEDNLSLGTLGDVDKQDVLDIKNTVLKMEEVLGGGIAALGSGALAGIGALGGVGALASASTGTAIASLSGAAATNATLAWLGGGSLATGGLGMAGGMAVLGGIVAAPVLAVGGMVMASKAEKAKHTASKNYEEAKIAMEQMDSACVVLDGIYRRIEEFIYILEPLNNTLEKYIWKLKKIVNKSNDWRLYTQREKETVMAVASIAKTVKNICDTPIINKKGEVTKKSRIVIKSARKIFKRLQNDKEMDELQKLHLSKKYIYRDLLDFTELFRQIKEIEFVNNFDESTNRKYSYIPKNTEIILKEFLLILEELDNIFDKYVSSLEEIVNKSNDWNVYTEKEKEIIMSTILIAKTVKNICDTPIIDKDGKATKESKEVLKKAKELKNRLSEV